MIAILCVLVGIGLVVVGIYYRVHPAWIAGQYVAWIVLAASLIWRKAREEKLDG